MLKCNEILENLSQFHGSGVIYKMALFNTRYTEGIKYLANTADCHWLATDVSIMGKSLLEKSYFVTIDFKKCNPQIKDGPMATISYSDGNGNLFCSQEYGFTDFPLDKLRLYFVNNTLMLPSEY
jgi:hypothetical protein